MTQEKITQEFVSYDQALALKELGFDEPTSFYWEDNIIRPLPMKDEIGAFHFNRHAHTENEWICAPTFSQAFRWFRETYQMYYTIIPADLGKYEDAVPNFQCGIYSNQPVKTEIISGGFKTYEEAELACLMKLIHFFQHLQLQK